MHEDDESFEAFERDMRLRSVLESERERVTRGYPADVALQTHGAALEDEIFRALEREAKVLLPSSASADILNFPATE